MRTPIFGDSWWTVRIDNASNAATTILAVDVKPLDANGFEVPDGCTQANNIMPLDQAFDRSMLTALTGSLQDGSDRLPLTSKQTLRDALAGHYVKQWQLTLPPHQHAVMAHTTTDPNYRLRITIDYEDDAGYQWRRTEASQPKRINEQAVDYGILES